MREILFRGKRLDNGEWVFGYFCEFANNRTGEQESYIQTVKQDGRIDLIHKVDPSAVGQYTGLKDKNGKRIFEGDVVIYDNSPYNAYCTPQKGEIIWRNGSLCFEYRPWNSAMYRSLCSDDFFAAKCEVIGNIHDNPELMGGGGADV